MEFIKCKLCRETFSSYGGQVCPACLEQLDKDFFVVRDYIYDHPNQASVEQVAEATGVKEKHIVFLLQDGRLVVRGPLGDAFTPQITCQICGRVIPSGKICTVCQGSLTKQLDSASAAIDSAKNANTSYVTPRSSKKTP